METKPFHANYLPDELAECEAKLAIIKKNYGQVELHPYIVNLNSYPGSRVPLLRPKKGDSGKSETTRKYPDFKLPQKNAGLLASRLGYAPARNRSTVNKVLAGLERSGFAVAVTGNGRGQGKIWFPTRKGRKASREISELYHDNGFSPLFEFNLRGYDRQGFDRFGVTADGHNRSGEYVGFHHIFKHYYKSDNYGVF